MAIAITGIIKTALEITGMALYPLKEEVVLEFEMRFVCHYSKSELHQAFVNNHPLIPDSTGNNKNILIEDATDYLSWDLNIAIGKITAVKKNMVEFIDLENNSMKR